MGGREVPEAGWKPAALPGAWRQQHWGWAERGAGGSPGGSSRRPAPHWLHGVLRLPGLEALSSEGVWVESCNYPVERDLSPQHTPSVCPNPGDLHPQHLPAGAGEGGCSPRHVHI